MVYCSHVWAGAPSCFLEMLDKLQNGYIYMTVGPPFAAFLEPLAHPRYVASLSRFTIGITLVNAHPNWIN